MPSSPSKTILPVVSARKSTQKEIFDKLIDSFANIITENLIVETMVCFGDLSLQDLHIPRASHTHASMIQARNCLSELLDIPAQRSALTDYLKILCHLAKNRPELFTLDMLLWLKPRANIQYSISFFLKQICNYPVHCSPLSWNPEFINYFKRDLPAASFFMNAPSDFSFHRLESKAVRKFVEHLQYEDNLEALAVFFKVVARREVPDVEPTDPRHPLAELIKKRIHTLEHDRAGINRINEIKRWIDRIEARNRSAIASTDSTNTPPVRLSNSQQSFLPAIAQQSRTGKEKVVSWGRSKTFLY